MAHVSRFKKRSSDRSGFDYKEIELVKDKPYKVGGDEFDTPPPSKESLGGEGEVSGSARANSEYTVANTNTPEGFDNPTFYITAAGGITPTFSHPFMKITGSNGAIDISADPQISRGRESQVLSLICVDSSITLENGTGLSMMGSSNFIMNSGDIITFIYSTSNTAWNETSRSRSNN